MIPPVASEPPARLGPGAAAIMAALHEAGSRVLLLPDDWAIIDGVTGERRRSQIAIHRLALAGWLRPIRRGTYAVRSESGSLRVSALELVGALARGPHLVTAGQALARHGLPDQAFREIVVVVPHAHRPWSWQGTHVRYVRMPAGQIWGGRDHHFDHALTTTIARPARAILDSIAHPHWGISISQVVEAADRASRHDPAFVERLALAASRYGNAMASRRLGFIIERLEGPEAARAFAALRGSSHTYARLMAQAPLGECSLDSSWRIAENVPFDLLAAHRQLG